MRVTFSRMHNNQKYNFLSIILAQIITNLSVNQEGTHRKQDHMEEPKKRFRKPGSGRRPSDNLHRHRYSFRNTIMFFFHEKGHVGSKA